ncbi:FAST kinase domain-containing protein 5, mitochondrial [Lycorma delicatula]|uniref:FAST kinase domain-containing protein 5, mitochondrial n=1 Tax=Lycorma delicatula TaxID=130591 RepID=UPI003F51877C
MLGRVIPRLTVLKYATDLQFMQFRLFCSRERNFIAPSTVLSFNLTKNTRDLCSQSFLSDFKKCEECFRLFSTIVHPNVDEDSTSNKGKIYFELENEVFHNYFENNQNYSETIHRSNTKIDGYDVTEEQFKSIIDKDCWTGETVDDYFTSFVKAAKYSSSKNFKPISDPVFKHLCDAFPSMSSYFTDDQLIKSFICLQNWPEAPGVREENFLKVWKSLDSVCVMRITNWNYKKLLYMMDLWYSLKLTRLSLFVRKSVLKCIQKARRLQKQGLVQLMFYLNTIRHIPKGESSYELEYFFSKLIRSLTIEEVGIVCAGFFKSQSRISTAELMNDIIEMLIEHCDNVDRVTLASVVKFVRYSQKNQNIGHIIKLLDKLSTIMDKYGLQVNVHIALITATKHISHPQTFYNLIEQFLSTPKNARLKDIEKIMLIISLFNINTKSADKACQLIISELESKEREWELDKHVKSLIKCLCHLSFKNYYSEKLTSRVLDVSLIKSEFGNNMKNTLCRELIQFDQNVELEFPKYRGNRLPVKITDFVSKISAVYIPRPFDKKKDVVEILQDLMIAIRTLVEDRDELWHINYFIPHFRRADVLLHVDKNNQFLDIPSEIKNRKHFTGYIKPPNCCGELCLFVVAGFTDVSTGNELSAEINCKLRQLKLLGYSPFLVPINEWVNLVTPETRLDYIKEKLFSRNRPKENE